jgi:hypothetical protein
MLVFLVLTWLASAAGDSVPGSPPLRFMPVRNDCSSHTWFQCPRGYGLQPNNSAWNQCCGPKTNASYCPGGYQACNVQQGCCPNGLTNFCWNGATGFCCPENYSVCDFANMKCQPGGCLCTGCVGPNPCQFNIGCSDCQACCANYIPAICKGWACSGGQVASPNKQANVQCNSK